MENKDILIIINDLLEKLKENLFKLSDNEFQNRSEDISSYITKYLPTDGTEIRIKENRSSDLNILIKRREQDKIKTIAGVRDNRNSAVRSNIDAIKDFRYWMGSNKVEVEAQIEKINSFNRKYPYVNGKINNLTLDNYVVGFGNKTFCWELENNTPGAMGQQGADFYHIYYEYDAGKYRVGFTSNYRYEDEENAKRIFTDLKRNLEEILSLAKDNKIEQIEHLRKDKELPRPNVLMKILALYFPEKFIGYYSKEYIYNIASMININGLTDVFVANSLIAKKVIEEIWKDGNDLKEIFILVGFARFLWDNYDKYVL